MDESELPHAGDTPAVSKPPVVGAQTPHVLARAGTLRVGDPLASPVEPQKPEVEQSTSAAPN